MIAVFYTKICHMGHSFSHDLNNALKNGMVKNKNTVLYLHYYDTNSCEINFKHHFDQKRLLIRYIYI